MTQLIGQSLGRYHILEQLGEGGMATVFKAYDTRLERDVAVKVIRRNAFPVDQLDHILKRFEREAKALARLSHPNIVGIMDYGDHEGAPYLVMEYLPGGTLKQRLGKPMPWQEAVRILVPIAEALGFAHEHSIVHRDVKPSNILLTEKGQPMLSDFGIAKILEGEDNQSLTTTGLGVGTPEYMAPEQWTGQAGPLSDLYSLGVLLYELVTGRKPYTADTPAAILLKQTSEPLPRPSLYARDLPDGIEKILLKALAKKPEDRYTTMAALAAAMENLLATTVQSVKLPEQAQGYPTRAAGGAATLQEVPGTPPPVRRTPPPPGAPAKPAGKAGGSKIIIPGVILGIVACLCLCVAAVLVYMGTQGNGPFAGLATETSTPTRTATRTPTRTPSPMPEVSILGAWTLYYDWDCDGEDGSTDITFYNDYTFSIGGSVLGTWYTSGDFVDFVFDEYPNSDYMGTVYDDGTYMDGSMDNQDGDSGCWYALPSEYSDTSIDGTWDLYFDWGCTGEYAGPVALILYTDNTFLIEEESLSGTWYSSGDYIDMLFDEAPYAHYIGMIYSESYMDGSMEDDEGDSGCWYSAR
jgi:tRNA A-37 threonylcarbamoyl transferase component Bud32